MKPVNEPVQARGGVTLNRSDEGAQSAHPPLPFGITPRRFQLRFICKGGTEGETDVSTRCVYSGRPKCKA